MTARRVRLIGAGFAVVAVLVLTWLLGAAPLLAQAAATETQLAATTAVNDTQTARLAALAADARHLPALRAELGAADAALPATPELAAFFAELGMLQQRYGVAVTSYQGSAAVAATTGATANGAAPVPATGAATPAPSATPAPAVAPSAAISPSSPGGLTRIPMQLQATGGYKHLVDFVGGLQGGPRLFLVDKVAINAGVNGGAYTAAISGSVFVLPAGAGR